MSQDRFYTDGAAKRSERMGGLLIESSLGGRPRAVDLEELGRSALCCPGCCPDTILEGVKPS